MKGLETVLLVWQFAKHKSSGFKTFIGAVAWYFASWACFADKLMVYVAG